MLTLTVQRERTWHHTSFDVMGSVGELVIDGPATMVPKAVARLRALEGAWSRFDPTSELEQLHARAGRWTRVSADLANALRWAARMTRETNGLFDPTIRTALEAWGYDRTFRSIDATARSTPRSTPRSMSTVHADGPGFDLDDERRRARIRPGVRIDLGGIGKGLAADLVAGGLVRAGATAAYVCLGGDIHAAGEAPEGGWPVPLVHPLTGSAFAHHVLDEGGLVMSTSALRRWQCGEVDAHHLIDPRTAAPADSDVVAVAVASRSAARGEALAKAALIAGIDAGATLLTRADVTAWIVTAGDVLTIGPST